MQRRIVRGSEFHNSRSASSSTRRGSSACLTSSDTFDRARRTVPTVADPVLGGQGGRLSHGRPRGWVRLCLALLPSRRSVSSDPNASLAIQSNASCLVFSPVDDQRPPMHNARELPSAGRGRGGMGRVRLRALRSTPPLGCQRSPFFNVPSLRHPRTVASPQRASLHGALSAALGGVKVGT